MNTTFRKLNHAWNADPNAPDPRTVVQGIDLDLSFKVNAFAYTQFSEGDFAKIRFLRCSRYRLGLTNDEGWYRGQCRFRQVAPAWGEFYQVEGDLRIQDAPHDWIELGEMGSASRHYLFYFKDETFECDAESWDIQLPSSSVCLPQAAGQA
jgi:hypothetical protein